MPVVVLAASQAGHLLVLELRRGPGWAPAGSGVHAYVPALASVALGVAGALALAALLVVAGARVTRPGRPLCRTAAPRRWSALDLTAALFAAQLAIFLVQETIEAAAAGQPVPDATRLLLWGCLGQLPAALVASVVVRWLTTRLEAAAVDIAAFAGQALDARPALAPAAGPVRPATATFRGIPARGAVSQRGPPALLPSR